VKRFTQLFVELDRTNKTNAKQRALVSYFEDAEPADAAWAIYFLSGNRPKRPVNTRLLREWVAEAADIPLWLCEESYSIVGDLAETVALLLPDPEPENRRERPFHEWVEEELLELRALEEDEKKERLLSIWSQLTRNERFVWNKLITGAFRVGVKQKSVTKALAAFSGIDRETLAHRMMGNFEPTAESYEALLDPDTTDAQQGHPYPFFLAYPLEDPPETLGDVDDWLVEWKWDGIRGQVIRREGDVWIWSRGEELVTDRYPEIRDAALEELPDGTVVDGEIVAWKDGILDFGKLQRRIGRKKVGKTVLKTVPTAFIAYDLLEHEGDDAREVEQRHRRALLEQLLPDASMGTTIMRSPTVDAESWDHLADLRETARDRGVEGFMLKEHSSRYGVGRVRGPWWKWKVDPFSVDGILLYAKRGSGRRANLYTDYTFAVWDGDDLVPFAKAYSGLTDKEIRKVDRFVRDNTIERFGPVRSVTPELVFEIHFEGIRRSNRHKSGIAVRFPRMHRWRKNKPIEEADSIERLKALLPPEAPKPVPELTE
jgi:DNA ligase-1